VVGAFMVSVMATVRRRMRSRPWGPGRGRFRGCRWGVQMRRQVFRSVCAVVVALVVGVSLTAGSADAVEPIRPAAVAAAAVAVPGAVVSVTPARVADSRVNQQIIGAVPASGTATVQVTGHGGLPGVGVAAVVLNVTVVAPQAPGYVTVWPTGSRRRIPRT